MPHTCCAEEKLIMEIKRRRRQAVAVRAESQQDGRTQGVCAGGKEWVWGGGGGVCVGWGSVQCTQPCLHSSETKSTAQHPKQGVASTHCSVGTGQHGAGGKESGWGKRRIHIRGKGRGGEGGRYTVTVFGVRFLYLRGAAPPQRRGGGGSKDGRREEELKIRKKYRVRAMHGCMQGS